MCSFSGLFLPCLPISVKNKWVRLFGETQYVIDFNVFKFCSLPPSFRRPIFSQFASLNLCGNSQALVEETFF